MPSTDRSRGRDQRIELAPERGGPPIVITLTLPDDWQPSPGYGANTWEPVEQPDPAYSISLSLSPGRGGARTPDEIQAAVVAARRQHRMVAERPNINTGKPELDAVRADVTVVEDRALARGWLTILRVEFSDELLRRGPYKPNVSIRCYLWGPARDRWAQLAGRVPLTAGPRYVAQIRAACESAAIAE